MSLQNLYCQFIKFIFLQCPPPGKEVIAVFKHKMGLFQVSLQT